MNILKNSNIEYFEKLKGSNIYKVKLKYSNSFDFFSSTETNLFFIEKRSLQGEQRNVKKSTVIFTYNYILQTNIFK